MCAQQARILFTCFWRAQYSAVSFAGFMADPFWGRGVEGRGADLTLTIVHVVTVRDNPCGDLTDVSAMIVAMSCFQADFLMSCPRTTSVNSQ